MATYLVTGGAGFIGLHLANTLTAQGHSVVVLDDLSNASRKSLPPGVRLVVGDILDAGLVRQLVAHVDGCFHLAAIASVQRSIDDWPGTHRVNVAGTVNLFDAARATRVPVIYASSAAVYGDQKQHPIAEDATKVPQTPYGVDKLASEMHAAVAGAMFGVPTVGLRLFNVYGPGQDPRAPYAGVVSIFAERFAKGEPVTIFGDGRQVRDLVHVSDAVDHLIAARAVVSAAAPVLNVCTGRPTSVECLALLMRRMLRSKSEIIKAPARPGDIRISVGCPRLAGAALGISADRGVEDGLGWLVNGERGTD